MRQVSLREKLRRRVVAIRGLGLKRSIDMGKITPDETHRLAREASRSVSNANGILIWCGNLRSFEIIERLEGETGVPVVTSNQAGLWRTLRLVGVNQPVPNLGRFLREF